MCYDVACFVGTLKALDKSQNGHFEQTLVILGIKTPAVDYNVVYLDDDAAIEYDCSPGAIRSGH